MTKRTAGSEHMFMSASEYLIKEYLAKRNVPLKYYLIGDHFGIDPDNEYLIQRTVSKLNNTLEAQGFTLQKVRNQEEYLLGNVLAVEAKGNKFMRKGLNQTTRGATILRGIQGNKDLDLVSRRRIVDQLRDADGAITLIDRAVSRADAARAALKIKPRRPAAAKPKPKTKAKAKPAKAAAFSRFA